jgi:hypothetical protein
MSYNSSAVADHFPFIFDPKRLLWAANESTNVQISGNIAEIFSCHRTRPWDIQTLIGRMPDEHIDESATIKPILRYSLTHLQTTVTEEIVTAFKFCEMSAEIWLYLGKQLRYREFP